MTPSTAAARASSSSVATAAAAAFLVLAAALSFFGNDEGNGDGWRLRGTIAPFAPARLPAAGKGA